MRTTHTRHQLRSAIATLVFAVTLFLTVGAAHAQSKSHGSKSQDSVAHDSVAHSSVARDAVGPLAARTKGQATAPVTVYEMSDFQCPYCRRFARETFPAIDREYIATGKVRWIFINFPLTSVHQNSVPAAELGLCAAQQGVFWPVHDLLYRYQDRWAHLKEAEPVLLELADSAKMNRAKTLACLQAPATKNAVQADGEGAARSGAQSTPSFYIEGGLLTGAQPLPFFRRVLDSIYVTKVGPPREAPPAKR